MLTVVESLRGVIPSLFNSRSALHLEILVLRRQLTRRDAVHAETGLNFDETATDSDARSRRAPHAKSKEP
jgi:hypothetical protein